jgi:hypothetical protein
LVSGRVTYGLGVALALGALLAVLPPRRLWPVVILLALLASATSPVAGLFLGLAGAALLLSGRIGAGLLIAVPAALPLGLNALLFGDGGWMNISRTDTVRAVVASLVVAALVPLRPVRIGALLSAAGVLTAALIHTPVGLNATRLAVMFTLPALAAYATVPSSLMRMLPARGRVLLARLPIPFVHRDAGAVPRSSMPVWAVVLLVAAAAWWQPPVVIGDVRDIGNPTTDRAYFAPLLDRLRQETLTGRVEIPSTRDYWEAAHLDDVPLARGWLRQADIARNPLFFTDLPGARGTGVALTAQSYRTWLTDRAVQFVAVPDAAVTWSGRPEAALVTAGLPYLRPIWSSEHWRLYAVADPQPIVAPPATLIATTAAAVTFEVPAAGEIAVRVHYYRWLHASGGARVKRNGDWTVVHTPTAGRYTLTS